jgi:hypothetical protein
MYLDIKQAYPSSRENLEAQPTQSAIAATSDGESRNLLNNLHKNALRVF